VTDAAGRTRDDEPRVLGYGLTSVARWPAGGIFEERYGWVVPADLAPGRYTLSLTVWAHRTSGDAIVDADAAPGRAPVETIEVGAFRVQR